MADHYHVWCDLKPGVKDLDLVAAIDAMLGHLKGLGKLEGHTVSRRKLGFGPPEIGEWHIDIRARNLAQLEEAFDHAAQRRDGAPACDGVEQGGQLQVRPVPRVPGCEPRSVTWRPRSGRKSMASSP